MYKGIFCLSGLEIVGFGYGVEADLEGAEGSAEGSTHLM